ncbi:MAG TPA: BrnT family toxin [Candidatus Methanoperedens sp.]|nr:BrnT family toxin [Candidatus Methanoperedens sp.]
MVNWKNLDLEFDEHAFKHGIKDYEIEQIFKGRIYKRKIYFNKELRYQIIGKAFGRLIMVIVVPLGNNKLKVFSARMASEYKGIYNDKAK